MENTMTIIVGLAIWTSLKVLEYIDRKELKERLDEYEGETIVC